MRTFTIALLAVAFCSVTAFATEPGFNTEPIAPKFNDAPMVTSEFGMGLFVPDAGTLAQQQETICIDGVCYPASMFQPTTTITRFAPAPTSFVFEAPQEGVEVASDPPMMAVEVCPICGLPKTNQAVSSGVTTTTVTSSVATRNRGYGLFGNRARPGLFARWAAGWRASRAARSAMRGW